jgi:lipid-binding SYLF domain-containing protein
MKSKNWTWAFAPALLLLAGLANAGKYEDTISLFKNAGESSAFFGTSYGYAVFPTIGEGAIGIGGAGGKGRVYVHGKFVGTSTMGQVSVGFQLGGKAYSQIIFFKDKRALDEFESGSFEFGAGASAIAITASANASVNTDGTTAGASGGDKNARAVGDYQKGMAVFSIAKGGLMYSAALDGQKYSFTAKGSS